jgi:serine/threonine protein kinase
VRPASWDRAGPAPAGSPVGYTVGQRETPLSFPTGPFPDGPDETDSAEQSDELAFLRALARAPDRTPLLGKTLGQGRFELGRQLGEGGFGVVYEAFDHKRSARVALKVLRRSDPSSLYLFKQEFRSLAGLSHPNLVELYELHADDDRWFFTMELVDGQPSDVFFEDCRARGQLEPIRALLQKLAATLSSLHREGKLHRDIKPSNVMVRSDGRPVLLDFGLVTDLRGQQEPPFAGTPAYMAPERTPSPASDCYALGVLLHEALTGDLPGRAPAPSEPEDLARLCAELLHPQPSLRPTAEQILARLGAVSPLPSSQAPFVGRSRELLQLGEALDRARAGSTVVAMVHGASGMGKSALLHHFLEGHDGPRLVGRCFAQESVPYKGFDGIADALYRYLATCPPEARAALLPRVPGALGRLFPVLQRLPELAASQEMPEPADGIELRRWAFSAFRELFVNLARTGAPVVAIDDLQWGDLDSVALLLDLVRAPDPPPLLLVVVYRTDEADSSPVITALREALHSERYAHAPLVDVPLAELEPQDSEALASALAVRAGASVRPEVVAAESRGVPFFITELVDAPPGADGLGVAGLVQARVAALGEAARRLLEVVSIAGRPLPRRAAGRAALSEGEAQEPWALSSLVARHLLRVRQAEDREELLPYHDRIREAVVGLLSPEARAERHHRLALVLEQEQAEPEELVHHFLAAGRRPEASRYAALAASRAHDALALVRAAQLYELALELGVPDPGEARALRIRRAEALGDAGRPREAALAHLAVVAEAEPAVAHAHRRRAMEHLLLGGYTEEGLRLLDQLLREVKVQIPRARLLELGSLALLRGWIRLRGTRFREHTTLSEADRLRIDTCWSAALGLGVHNPLRAAGLHARHLLYALRAGEPLRIARALLLDAGFAAMSGNRRRSSRALQQGRQLAARLCDPYTTGFCHLAAGVVALSGGSWREASVALSEGERAFAPIASARWERDFVRSARMASLWMLGEVRELASVSAAFIQDALERGNLHGAAAGRLTSGSLVQLAADRPDVARHWARELLGSLSPTYSLHAHRALAVELRVALYLGERGRPWRLLQERGGLLARSGLLRLEIVRLEQHYWRGLAAVDAAEGPRDPRLRVARAEARHLEQSEAAWARAVGLALQAAIARRCGEEPHALELMERTERACAEVDMALVAALARRRRGLWLGGEEGQRLQQEADQWLVAAAIRNPERMTAMVLGPEPV